MKLTTRSEYALLALVYLARQPQDHYVTVQTIAEAQGIPPKFLAQLLLAMKHAHYVKSSKGQHGGYQLGMPAEKITLADVIRFFDGALAPTESASRYFYESTPIEREKKMLRVFKEIREFVSAKLEKATIADVA